MERPVEVLLHHMPGVIAKAENDWARDFAKSILCQSKKHCWEPSPKQLVIMRELVGQMFDENDFCVIEDS